MATVRLKGLISRMQRVRQQLVAGIPEDQADEFRADVRDTVAQVEALCAAHRATPRQLPHPSYQAYQFLKTLDLEHLPATRPTDTTLPPLRIGRLLQGRERTQAALTALALHTLETGSALMPNDQLATLSSNITATALRVEELARQAQSHVGRLPLPSRQAYAWLKFLSIPENLQCHLSALRCAYTALKEVEGQKRYLAGSMRLTLEFYHTESEWRVHTRRDEIHATFSEGFIGAHDKVIQALVRMAFHARRKSYRQIVREYSNGDEYAETLQAIELPTTELDPNVRGRFHNLQRVFERVNASYFDGQLTSPRLTWNRTNTIHLMGYYQRAIDTVMISISLDHPDVPDWAIDHVMHHELLHRVLGSRVVNGRLFSHTPEFRAAERAFRDYERANAFINAWSAHLARR